jgi:hypothetical protein
MADSKITDQPLTSREREALIDIAGWSTCPYIWKQASMRKLEARGWVKKTGQKFGDAEGYVITPAGREAMKNV